MGSGGEAFFTKNSILPWLVGTLIVIMIVISFHLFNCISDCINKGKREGDSTSEKNKSVTDFRNFK